MMEVGPGKWTIIPDRRPAAAIQLVCFHHLGGGGYGFLPWANHLAPHIEIVAVQLPGRENRHAEEPLTTADQVFDGLVPVLQAQLRGRYALFGHSMGAGLAYRFASRIRQTNELPPPQRLFLSGAAPPSCRPANSHDHNQPAASDRALLALLRRTGGVAPEILRAPERNAAILDLLRADFQVLQSIDGPDDTPLPISFTLVRGVADKLCTRSQIEGWRTLTAVDFEHRTVPGGHFYNDEGVEKLLNLIDDRLA